MNTSRVVIAAFTLLLVQLPGPTLAEEISDQDLKQANNPLASFRAINVHNYWMPEVSGTDDTANTMWVRYAQPFGKWLMRASVPIQRVSIPGGETGSGVGYSNVFAAYLFDTGNPAISTGVGPIVGLPTATDGVPGPRSWSAGVAAVHFDAKSSQFQWGGLVTWLVDIGANDEADEVNLLAVQPFALYQLGGGTYLRSTGIWNFNIENDTYSVPIGLGVGKVVRSGNKVFNLFVEPQATVLSKGLGQAEFQMFVGFNTQLTQ